MVPVEFLVTRVAMVPVEFLATVLLMVLRGGSMRLVRVRSGGL